MLIFVHFVLFPDALAPTVRTRVRSHAERTRLSKPHEATEISAAWVRSMVMATRFTLYIASPLIMMISVVSCSQGATAPEALPAHGNWLWHVL